MKLEIDTYWNDEVIQLTLPSVFVFRSLYMRNRLLPAPIVLWLFKNVAVLQYLMFLTITFISEYFMNDNFTKLLELEVNI